MRREIVFLLCLSCATSRSDLRAVSDATHAHVADTNEDVELGIPEEAKPILAKPMDVDACVRVALVSNRELRATLREMGVARGQLAQARTIPNPVFELEVLPERNSALELRAEYDVTRLLLTPMRANAASADVDAARFRAAARVIVVGAKARADFFSLLAAEKKLEIATRSLDALAAGRDAAEALHRSGNLRELDFATQDAAYQEARAEVAELELQRAHAREMLIRTLGVHGTFAGIQTQGALPEPPKMLSVDGLESKALASSFDLRARKFELEALARSVGLSRTEGWIPDVSADVHILQGRDETSGAITGGWNVGAGVRASVPIFDQKRGQTAAIDARFSSELERYIGAAIDVRSHARETEARIRATHARARHYADVVLPARKRVVEQAILQYNAMQLSVFQLLDMKHAELTAELASVDATLAWVLAQTAFDAMTAGGSLD